MHLHVTDLPTYCL